MIDYDKKHFKVCANCKYWDYFPKGNEQLDGLEHAGCHRYPANVPLVEKITDCGHVIPEMLMLDSPLMGHPQTFGCDWCGEFEPDENLPFPDGIYMP